VFIPVSSETVTFVHTGDYERKHFSALFLLFGSQLQDEAVVDQWWLAWDTS